MPKRYHQHSWRLPADATEVVLVRHGASQAHEVGVPFGLVDGHADPPLAPEGEEQARAVGARLALHPPDALFVTTLQRTAQTAAPLAAATGMTPVVIAALREVHLGDWEGGEVRVRSAEGDPLVAEIFARQRWDVIPGAETTEAFAARVRAGLDEVVAATGPGRRAVAIAHGGVIGELCHQAVGGGPPLAFVHVENASVSRVVVFGDGRLRLRSFNDTEHLSGALPAA